VCLRYHINATDGKGRSTANVERVRAVWQEDDNQWQGALPLEPSIVVETSPNHFHRYWRVDGLSFEDFAGVMDRMTKSCGSDPGAKDLAHAMRLPGFWHRKREPFFQVRIVENTGAVYSREQILAAFPPIPKVVHKPVPMCAPTLTEGEELDKVRSALAFISADDRDVWVKVGMALKKKFGDRGWALWDEWSSTSTKYDEHDQPHVWRSFKRADGIGIGTVFHLAQEHGWQPETRKPQQARGRPKLRVVNSCSSDDDIAVAEANPGEAETEADCDPRPRLWASSAHPEVTVSEIALKLPAADGRLFDRGSGILVRVSFDQVQQGAVASPVAEDALSLIVHQHFQPYRLEQGNFNELRRVPCGLPRKIAAMFLKSPWEWKFAPLNGIATSPLLDKDGAIRVANGYDEASGLWCENVPDIAGLVPEKPTREEAKEALLVLRRTFRTFCFADAMTIMDGAVTVVDLSKPPGMDESCFLHALLTGACRPSLWLAPGIFLRAPSITGSGSGKGLLARRMFKIAFGRQPSAITGGGSPEELEKRVATALIGAEQAIFIDNLNDRTFRSDTVESTITERPSKVRLLGKMKEVQLSSSALVVMTGNGTSLSGDTARRFPLMINLDAKMENPDARPLDASAIMMEVTKRRPELLVAALTVFRYGRTAKGIKRGLALGSFDQWCAWVRDPLLALGCKDPAERLVEIKKQDPRRQALHDLFTLWRERHGSDPVTAYELHNDLKAILVPKVEERTRQRVAARLTALAGTRLGGFVLLRVPAESSSPYASRSAKWEPDKYSVEVEETSKPKPEDGADIPF
jgi:Primase C terminal 2 (PriCT-2)/RepB DNA-primase from phage plasmid